MDTADAPFTLAKVIQNVQRLNIPDSKRKKYIVDIKTFFRITGCDDLEHCLKSFSKIKRVLETSKQLINASKKYAINSKKGFIQSIVYEYWYFKSAFEPAFKTAIYRLL